MTKRARENMGRPGENCTIRDCVLTYLQYIYPQHLLSTWMFRLCRWKNSTFKNRFTRWFIKHYEVDMSLADNPDPLGYPDFNSFFTRSLRPGVRPIAPEPDTVVSPADGVISQVGPIEGGCLLQAKNCWYSVEELLQGDSDEAGLFHGGDFATIYLSPRDYHRVHMPYDGALQKMSYVPGRLFSVNESTTRALPRLFTRNERIVCNFDTSFGPMALVMVGALLVGSIETVWEGLVTPPHGQKRFTRAYPANNCLKRGEEMGRFNMGSTVIVLLPPGTVTWLSGVIPGARVQMGQEIAIANRDSIASRRQGGDT